MKKLPPGIIDASLFVSLSDDLAKASVASGKDTLQDAHIGFMIIVFDALLVQLVPAPPVWSAAPLPGILHLCTWRPLERRKGLWNEKGGAGNNLNLSNTFFLRHGFKKNGRYLIGKFRNPADILFCFRRQSEHEIQFYPGPAAFECMRPLSG